MARTPAKLNLESLRVGPGTAGPLSGRDPRGEGLLPDRDKQAALDQLATDVQAIDGLQDRLFAEGKRALLVVLQGMDTSGKDGTIRGVFNATGPLGVTVTPFGRPTPTELAHDFLWRVHQVVPRKGVIGIFNRSHYEDVLVGCVRQLAPPEVIEQRYDQINAFEQLLTQTGTTVLKFMLHISKEEQKQRLQDRLDDPTKNWKWNSGDLDDRALWADYQSAYEVMLERCATDAAPWWVIPADSKWRRNVLIAQIVRATLEAMNPAYPQPSPDLAGITIPD